MHDLKERIAAGLEEARRRSLDLLAPLPEQSLVVQHSPLMSPLVWDLAHIGKYEELWLLRAVGGAEPLLPEYDRIYNAAVYTRSERVRLPLLGPEQSRAFAAEVRGRVLDGLERAELDGSDRLTAGGFVYGMIIQHEHQHDETMLATLQLRRDGDYPAVDLPASVSTLAVPGEALVPGGLFTMGMDDDPWAYDNERGAHVVDLPPFWIDTTPVTNAAYTEFVQAGGYRRPELWSPRGWAWRQEAGLEHPEFWQAGHGGAWTVRRYGRDLPLVPDEPVQHVCWFEADAYARWAGKRLPTEPEWEKAARWDPSGVSRRQPWGDAAPRPEHANLGQRRFGPAPVGSFPGGVSAAGCHQLIGDVWEWTSSDLHPYPGFVAFPYAEYSAVFFGDEYKVLRGGSWATHHSVARSTFRSWDYPIRRQIFSGFRCARDAT